MATSRSVGRSRNYETLRALVGAPELVSDLRFRRNADRVANNAELAALPQEKLRVHPSAHWLAVLEEAPCCITTRC